MTPTRRFWARLGFADLLPLADLGVFAAGCVFVLAGFGVLAGLTSGVSSAKRILGETTAGFDYLREQNLEAARTRFAGIEEELRSWRLDSMADRISVSSRHLLAAVEILQQQQDDGGFLDLDLGWDSAANVSSDEFYFRLAKSHERLSRASGEIIAAEGLLSELPLGVLPGELGVEIKSGLGLLTQVRGALEQATRASGLALSLFGGERKTYLLIFQNNNEARATGGFIGTYGLVELGEGKMKINKIESIYEPDGQLKELIAAPGPLQRQATEHWAMRDSNWFADFPESSRKTLEFLEKETGILAAGVISLTPDLFEDLLAISGPVEMPDYEVVLTAENFREVVQTKTSMDYDRALNQPKKFLADFTPKILARLSAASEEQSVAIAEALLRAVSEKQVMMFSLDPAIQRAVEEYNVGGQIRKTPGDYLAIIHSNVGGGKTDLGMTQSVKKSVSIDEFGRQVSSLRITRANHATGELYFPKNVDFMRVLVPDGAWLLSSSGFDSAELLPSSRFGAATDPDLARWDGQITRDWQTGVYLGRESGYTALMGFLELGPGESKTVEFTYVLPQTGPDYSLLLQKQAGAPPYLFDLEVLASGREIVYQYPDNLEAGIVSEDRFYSVVAR